MTPDERQIMQQLKAAGLPDVQARRAAGKLAGEQDRFEIDPKTGKTRPAPVGPSLMDEDATHG